ncbi:MAG TPA: peroxide stress protein YaaA [Candidatus Ratteibacteria bacterium]|nr:peroxide stress protein YaaA [Candidatus Ratteibacteria bacterium]
MNKNILFIITCSNGKIEGGITNYNYKSSICNYISSECISYLMEGRQFNLTHIKNGGFTRQKKILKDLPYNKELKNSFDFGGKEEAKFLPAYERYCGRIYKEIDKETWKNRRHQVLIFSGLYGWVLPEEFIQRYSLHLRDSQLIIDIWKGEIATFILESFVRRNNIDVLVDCTGEDLYREIVDWEYFEARGYDVFHIYGEQNAGPSVLPAIGYFLQNKGLTGEDSELLNLMNKIKYFQTTYEKIWFIKGKKELEELQLPREEGPYELQEKVNQTVTSIERPSEFDEIESIHKVKIIFNYKVLSQIIELPKEIYGKFLQNLKLYIKNPEHAGLKRKKIQKDGETFYRFRINDFYRVHVDPYIKDPVDKNKKILNIRAVGGAKVESISH